MSLFKITATALPTTQTVFRRPLDEELTIRRLTVKVTRWSTLLKAHKEAQKCSIKATISINPSPNNKLRMVNKTSGKPLLMFR